MRLSSLFTTAVHSSTLHFFSLLETYIIRHFVVRIHNFWLKRGACLAFWIRNYAFNMLLHSHLLHSTVRKGGGGGMKRYWQFALFSRIWPVVYLTVQTVRRFTNTGTTTSLLPIHARTIYLLSHTKKLFSLTPSYLCHAVFLQCCNVHSIVTNIIPNKIYLTTFRKQGAFETSWIYFILSDDRNSP